MSVLAVATLCLSVAAPAALLADGPVQVTSPGGIASVKVHIEPTPKPDPVAPVEQGAAFWRRLANCESATGRSTKHYVGFFQFRRGDTANKVGIDGSESYEEQRAAAIHWASQVNPGSRAGWPHCWHVARG